MSGPRGAAEGAGRPRIRPAGPADLAAVRTLLVAAQLPPEGLEEQFDAGFAVAEAEGPAGALVGAAGIEVYGRFGLLRSVVVAPPQRGTGLGKALVADRMAWARAGRLEAVYLLTTTAPDFFASLGFARTARDAVPAEVQASREFASVCPGTSVVMVRAMGVGIRDSGR